MIEFRALSDDYPDLAMSPMVRTALATLRRAQERDEGIDLTATKAFKQDIVHWAVTHFEWPGRPCFI